MKWLIVFDLDGVLADVSRSYRATVHETARQFFRPARRWRELPSPLFSFTELARLKESGGLNNDWDLTYRVIAQLMGPLAPMRARRLQDPWERFEDTMGRLELEPLLRFLSSSSRPLSAHPRRRSRFVEGLCRGEVGSGNLVKQIFQEVYLGGERFQATYGIPPRVHQGNLERERLLAPSPLLRRLASRHLLAIATGRPEAEARAFLARFHLAPYFREVRTLEDSRREELRVLSREGKRVRLGKPNPFLLDAVAVGGRVERRYYVGDMPDDMRAALRSAKGFRPIGLVQAAPDREALRRKLLQAGAQWVAEDFGELAAAFANAAGPPG
jgi:phosphoglycolate phosphatase-like HAD superfamily hydrolase